MGMYTELFIATRINADAPDAPEADVIKILKYMIGEGPEPAHLPAHRLFNKPRWSGMLRQASYYFVPTTVHKLEWDSIGNYWSFITFSNFKNYDGEIDAFIDWLGQYVELDGGRQMIGYHRYEEEDEPTIIYLGEEA
jgi:hypothetical protein